MTLGDSWSKGEVRAVSATLPNIGQATTAEVSSDGTNGFKFTSLTVLNQASGVTAHFENAAFVGSGGVAGLNLTAADYVVHLDPWWNPAAEDQATDRAHRFGQTRPVTVYRLLTRNTIEEKVLRLHGYKRELARDVLSGGGKREAPLGIDELRALVMR